MTKSESEITSKDLEVGSIVTEPGNGAQYQTGTWRSQKPILDREKCIKCGLCYIYCPEECIQPVSDSPEYFDIDLYHCKGCAICDKECPTDAIIMVEEAE